MTGKHCSTCTCFQSETTAPVWKRMRDQVPANGTWIWWDYGKGPMLQRAQDFASEDDGYWIEATPPLRSPEEPPEGYPGIAHDYEKLRYVLSQVRDHSTDDWAKGIAREAVGPQRELSPSEAASFTKTLARSPRRVESMPSEKASEPQLRKTRYCDYDMCPHVFDPAHSNNDH